MGRVTLTLPRLGETMEEAKVVEWLVAPGAAFARGDVLLEVETDKTVVEVPALTAGTLIAQLVAAGDTVALDQPIAEVDVEGAVAAAPEPPRGQATVVPVVAPVPFTLVAGRGPAASPAARAAARAVGVDLGTLSGTGRRGRIQAVDVHRAQGGAPALHPLGTKLPVVLLHGLFDDRRGWRDLPRRIEAAGHAVLALDLPGHGDSPPAPNLDAVVEQIAAALPGGRLRLIGHSLGAAIAVRLAVQLQGRVERLILSAPAGLGQHLNADFTDGMRTAQTPAALARALALLGAGPMSDSVLSAELVRLKSLRASHGVLADMAVQSGFQQIDITADLARLTCPVTVMFGTADRILDWHDAGNLPPTTAIHLIRGAGHLPHLAAPEVFLDLVLDAPARERRIAHA